MFVIGRGLSLGWFLGGIDSRLKTRKGGAGRV